ncbi:hypothetical protein [Rhodobacter sp. CZR27]|uniref:hypothetical protein n=1 Tax=Rhodobacter sp. CZR27 TaxID=2033869 RepID=UPI000BBE3830|nr:hypothetical protein [Rhodobacter sp. CZR27]
MIRRAARAALSLALLASLVATLLTAARIARDPALAPFTEAAADEIVAASDRLMSLHATPEAVLARIEARLAESPPNAVALHALETLAADRGVPLPPDLVARLVAARDKGLLEQAAGCLRCAWQPADCALSAELFCQAPMVLTPAGDVAGLARAGQALLTGAEVDQVDLLLSAAGLGATAVLLASGGSSGTVKLGTGTLRLAHRMKLLSPPLARLVTRTAATAVDWARLPAARSAEDVARLVHPEALRPLGEVAEGLGRIGATLSPAQTLHLLRHIDGAADARGLAAAAEALGPRTVARAEMLGKTRLLRTTLRWSATTRQLMASLAALLASATALLCAVAQSVGLRLVRRLAGPA